jgi:predicted TIM-barrel fold metal-dependent hydrolase
VLHLNEENIVPLGDTIRALPVPFVIDHMGRVEAKKSTENPAFKALLELVRRDNGWIKVTGAERIAFPPYDEAMPIARALVEAVGDRVLWGTDYPHPNATHEADEADLVDLIAKFAPDVAAQQRLLVGNPTRLYGFA